MTYPPAYPPPQGYSGPPNPQDQPPAACGVVIVVVAVAANAVALLGLQDRGSSS